jgi:hypothetical protein
MSTLSTEAQAFEQSKAERNLCRESDAVSETQRVIREALAAEARRIEGLRSARSVFAEIESAYGNAIYRDTKKVATRARRGRELVNELLELLEH